MTSWPSWFTAMARLPSKVKMPGALGRICTERGSLRMPPIAVTMRTRARPATSYGIWKLICPGLTYSSGASAINCSNSSYTSTFTPAASVGRASERCPP